MNACAANLLKPGLLRDRVSFCFGFPRGRSPGSPGPPLPVKHPDGLSETPLQMPPVPRTPKGKKSTSTAQTETLTRPCLPVLII